MLMQALIVRSTFLFFSIRSAHAGYTSTAHPPATWTNNDFSLNRSYNPDNSLVRVILSLPLPGLGNDRSTGPAAIVRGFFCNQIDQLDCDSFLFSVVMLHSYSVNYSFSSSSFPAQVVWSANRDRPVRENATLGLKEDGNLILMDADGTPVWSTNTMGKSVVGMRVTENGRLVLFGNKSVSVWDSSDYPTDSWLLGQSLRKGQRLIANVSATAWSRGSFYIDVVTGGGGVEAYKDSDPPQLYYHYSFPHPKSNYVIFNNESIGGEPYLVSIYLHGTSSVQFMRLESDGHLRHYAWNTDGWNLLDDVFSDLDDCAYPMVCGEYGFCSNGECSCPDFTYFRLVDERQLNLDCDPITPLSCDSTKKDHLLLGFIGFLFVLKNRMFFLSFIKDRL